MRRRSAPQWRFALLVRTRSAMLDRTFSLTLHTIALVAGAAAAVLFLAGFIEYLQSGRWPEHSLLRLGYEWRLLRPRWFLAHPWGLYAHGLLAAIHVGWLLVGVAPLAWWLGGRFARR
jgi:hypothetical protein